MILEITYGYTVESADDPFVLLVHEAMIESFRHGGPGTGLCDILPICEKFFTPLSYALSAAQTQTQVKHWPTWMPFSFYQRHAAYTKTLVDKMFDWPLNWVEQQIVLSFPPSHLCGYSRHDTGRWDCTSISGPRPSGGRSGW